MCWDAENKEGIETPAYEFCMENSYSFNLERFSIDNVVCPDLPAPEMSYPTAGMIMQRYQAQF